MASGCVVYGVVEAGSMRLPDWCKRHKLKMRNDDFARLYMMGDDRIEMWVPAIDKDGFWYPAIQQSVNMKG